MERLTPNPTRAQLAALARLVDGEDDYGRVPRDGFIVYSPGTVADAQFTYRVASDPALDALAQENAELGHACNRLERERLRAVSLAWVLAVALAIMTGVAALAMGGAL